MNRDWSSSNHDARPAAGSIDMLVLHYTGMPTAEAALGHLCEPQAKVSAHYLIDEDGQVFQLVPEDRRAWHAGHSCWAGATDVNGCSIGIELVNPGHEFGYRPFPQVQMDSLVSLCRQIVARHTIPAHRVLGHADVAPARKQDPGELFDWAVLAANGVGLWPDAQCAPDGVTPSDLARFGYDLAGAGEQACATAFQRHWRPAQVDGVMDDDCLGRLTWLLDRAT